MGGVDVAKFGSSSETAVAVLTGLAPSDWEIKKKDDTLGYDNMHYIYKLV